MANETRTRSGAKRAPAKAASSRRSSGAKQPARKTRRVRRRIVSEFKPDSRSVSLSRLLYMTDVQKYRLLRWGLYIAVCVLCLVVQDCILSRFHPFGATTDLAVAAILLVTIMEGSEVGGYFALIASVVYHYSGSAPHPFCVALITIPGFLCALFRQKFWHRGTSSNLLCSAIAMLIYEIGLFLTALFSGLTRLDRFHFFLLTAAYSILVMIPLYQLIFRIGQMGGHVWKD